MDHYSGTLWPIQVYPAVLKDINDLYGLKRYIDDYRDLGLIWSIE